MKQLHLQVWSSALVATLGVWAVGAAAAADADPDRTRGQVGINLSGLSPFSTQWDFADLMKNAAQWTAGDPGAASFDANGWPTSLPDGKSVGTNVRLNSGGRAPDVPGGAYTVSWEGRGEFFLGDNGGASTFVPLGATGGSRTLNVSDDGSGIFFQINRTDSADPLRNVRIDMPTYGPGQVNAGRTFQHTFTDRIEPFGTVRFMDWMRANDNPSVTWDDRPRVGDRTYTTSRGVPVEHMVSLANELGSDAWFTMPVRADDGYVRSFATYVRDNLNPGLKAYVEYGNEVWGMPMARDYLESAAEADYGRRDMWYRSWADEAKADFSVWSEVFAGQEQRMLRVAAGQAGNRFHTPRFLNLMYENGVDAQDADPADLGERLFDVTSLAAYIGGSTYSDDATADSIIDSLFRELSEATDDTPTTFFEGQSFETVLPRGGFAWQRQLADEHGTPLIAYEGGQHVTPRGDAGVAWYDAYVAAQRDPRMYDFYLALLEAYLQDVGADGLVSFSSVSSISPFGAWGALEYQDQPLSEAPKYRALVDFIEGQPVPEPTSAAVLALGGLLLARRGSRAHAAD